MQFISRSRKLSDMLRVSLRPPPPMKSAPKARFSSTASQLEGGVSMVQGASRGIGLEFVRQLLEQNDKGNVVASCRNPGGATGLLELKGKFEDRLNIIPLDVTDESTIEAAAISIKENYGFLNLLINTSGVLSIPKVLHPETTMSKLEKSSLMLTYEINAVGPVLVVKHMWPLLKIGGGSGTNREFAVIANLSARVGSIGDNGLGGWHSYRSSKAALNQLTKTISVELARRKDPIICILLHPGTVDTDLSRPFQKNVPPEHEYESGCASYQAHKIYLEGPEHCHQDQVYMSQYLLHPDRYCCPCISSVLLSSAHSDQIVLHWFFLMCLVALESIHMLSSKLLVASGTFTWRRVWLSDMVVHNT